MTMEIWCFEGIFMLVLIWFLKQMTDFFFFNCKNIEMVRIITQDVSCQYYDLYQFQLPAFIGVR